MRRPFRLRFRTCVVIFTPLVFKRIDRANSQMEGPAAALLLLVGKLPVNLQGSTKDGRPKGAIQIMRRPEDLVVRSALQWLGDEKVAEVTVLFSLVFVVYGWFATRSTGLYNLCPRLHPSLQQWSPPSPLLQRGHPMRFNEVYYVFSSRQCAQNAHRLKLVGGKPDLQMAARIRRCKNHPPLQKAAWSLKLSGLLERNFPAGFSVMFLCICEGFAKVNGPAIQFLGIGWQRAPPPTVLELCLKMSLHFPCGSRKTSKRKNTKLPHPHVSEAPQNQGAIPGNKARRTDSLRGWALVCLSGFEPKDWKYSQMTHHTSEEGVSKPLFWGAFPDQKLGVRLSGISFSQLYFRSGRPHKVSMTQAKASVLRLGESDRFAAPLFLYSFPSFDLSCFLSSFLWVQHMSKGGSSFLK